MYDGVYTKCTKCTMEKVYKVIKVYDGAYTKCTECPMKKMFKVYDEA